MFSKPRERMRTLMASIPSRSIHAFVAVLSDGPTIKVVRSFHVGASPASKNRSQPDSDTFLALVSVQRSVKSTFPSRTEAIASVSTAILMTDAASKVSRPSCSYASPLSRCRAATPIRQEQSFVPA
jgi:hypothetical protein